MREFMLSDFLLLCKIEVSSFIENQGAWRNKGLKTVGKFQMNCWKMLIRRSRRDELLLSVRCINNIIKL